MKSINKWQFASAVALASVAGATWAHHSFAMFDMNKRGSITGTVRALEWTNPHIWLWVDVKRKDGKVVSYGFEGAAPGEVMRQSNWTKRAVTKGETITVEFAPLKNGKPGGTLGKVTKADGTTVGGSLGRGGGAPGGAPGGGGGARPGGPPPGGAPAAGMSGTPPAGGAAPATGMSAPPATG